MAATTAIEIRNLGKQYRLGDTAPLYGQLRDVLASPRQLFKRTEPVSIWALRNVTIDIEQGSVVGLVGGNGAGKSTLLKLLSRITEPTEGEARVYGRTASLLEVGTGFHPDLTGRENVFLNGSILGMTRAEIRTRFDEIVAFAEVDQFLDTPVKRYSSGMFVRLAFAVAAHLDPDILMVDEVLAVGDSAFQRKCLGKLQDIGRAGRTVVLVSHNMDTISRLCSTAIWISGGSVRATGATASVIGQYLSNGSAQTLSWALEESTAAPFRYHSVAVSRSDEEETGDVLPADVGIIVTFDFTVNGTLPPGRLSFRLDTEDGRTVVTSSSTDSQPTLNEFWQDGRHRMSCTIPSNLLAPGRYSMSVSEPRAAGDLLHEGILRFTVSEQGSLVSRDGRLGVIAPRFEWNQESTS